MTTKSKLTVTKGNIGSKYKVTPTIASGQNFSELMTAGVAGTDELWSCRYTIRHKEDGVIFSSGEGILVPPSTGDNTSTTQSIFVVPIATVAEEFVSINAVSAAGVVTTTTVTKQDFTDSTKSLDIGEYVVGVRVTKKDKATNSIVEFDKEVARIPLEIVAAV
jgi:hypothetical protein